jgi:hypothetical protein
MYIRRKVFSRIIDEYGEERLYSTTELEQREFVDSKSNIVTGTRGAQMAVGRAKNYRKDVEKVGEAAKKYGGVGNLTNKEWNNWFETRPGFKEDVESYLAGKELTSKKLDQIAKGMEASSELAAAAGTRRAKTHESVRTAEGNTFKSGNKTLNVKASQEGQTATRMTEGAHNNTNTVVVSKASEGRKSRMRQTAQKGVVAREYVPKEANMNIGKGRETHNRHQPKGKPGKIQTNSNPGIVFTDAPKNMTTVTTATPNGTTKVSTGLQQIPGNPTPTRVNTVETTSIPRVNKKPNPTPKPPKMPKTAPAGNNKGNFFKNAWNTKTGKAALIGTGGAATGASLY